MGVSTEKKRSCGAQDVTGCTVDWALTAEIATSVCGNMAAQSGGNVTTTTGGSRHRRTHSIPVIHVDEQQDINVSFALLEHGVL